MRTTLQIDDDVLSEVRQLATSQGRTVGAVLSELARRALAPVGIATGGPFPTFDVPAMAPPITAEDVSRALEED